MKLLIGLAAYAAMACGQGEQATQPRRSRQSPGGPGVTGTLLVGNKGENTLSFIDLAIGPRARPGGDRADAARNRDLARRAAGGGGRLWRARRSTFSTSPRARGCAPSICRPMTGRTASSGCADGRILATTERSQSLTIVDTRNGDRVSAIATGQQGTHMVAVTPDGRRAFTANIAGGHGQRARSRRRHEAARHRGRRPAGGDRADAGRADALGRRPRRRAGAGLRHDQLRAARRGADRRGADPGRWPARTGAGSSPPISAPAASP